MRGSVARPRVAGLTTRWSLLIGAARPAGSGPCPKATSGRSRRSSPARASRALRGGAELVGGYSPGWSVLALGGTHAVVGFTAFAVGLWRSTGAAPLAAAQCR
jgi:hypothetical protein